MGPPPRTSGRGRAGHAGCTCGQRRPPGLGQQAGHQFPSAEVGFAERIRASKTQLKHTGDLARVINRYSDEGFDITTAEEVRAYVQTRSDIGIVQSGSRSETISRERGIRCYAGARVKGGAACRGTITELALFEHAH